MRPWSFPLVVHLSALFGLLTIVSLGVLCWVGYQRTIELIATNGEQIAERSAEQIRNEIDAIFAPVELGIALVGEHQVNEAATWPERLADFPVFERALDVSSPVNAFYIGYPDGDFFMIRTRLSEIDRQAFGTDGDVRYVAQSIDREDGRADGRFLFLDAAGNVTGQRVQPGYPDSYDPRVRPWYRRALAGGGLVRTDPYLFATRGDLGLTFAKRSDWSNTVVGADLNLDALSEVVRRQKPTPGSSLALADASGRIIAADDSDVLVRRDGDGPPAIVTIETIGAEALRILAGLPDANDRLLRYAVGDREFFGRMVPVDLRSGDSLTLLVSIPESELLAAAYSIRREMLVLSVIVFLVALALTVATAYSISRSLARLTRTAGRFREFDFGSVPAARSAVSEVRALTEGFQVLDGTLSRFQHLLARFSQEPDLTALLPAILGELSAILEVERALLYVVPETADGLTVAAVKNGSSIELMPPALAEGDAVPALVAACIARGGRQALAGRIDRTETALPGLAAMALPGETFDSALCYPLRDRKNNVIGAILFLEGAGAGKGARALVDALTGIAAVSLETRQLIASEKALFNAFIALIASAIDAKSAHTSGHCERVPELTKMLAEAAAAATDGPLRDFTLTEDDREAVHVAAWLHDCGKITSPEYVVDKATKLETIYDRLHEVRMRFEVLKRDAEIACLRAQLAGAEAMQAEAARDRAWQKLDADFAFVAACNEGGEFLSPADVERLRRIGGRTWQRSLDDRIGISQAEAGRKAAQPAAPLPATERLLADLPEHVIERPPREVIAPDNPWGLRVDQPRHLYNRGELHNLSVSRGTLTEEERYKINEHIVQTIVMLSKLPYPRHLRVVPELAGGHHEKIDGTGYPKRLHGAEMSPVARIMAIADIFEALTAVDRPYKKPKALSEAMRIMSAMAQGGHIDPDLFALFLTSGVYRVYAERYMPPDLVDPIDIAAFLPAGAA